MMKNTVNTVNTVTYKGYTVNGISLEQPLIVSMKELESNLFYDGTVIDGIEIPLSNILGIIDSVDIRIECDIAIDDFIKYNDYDIMDYYIKDVRGKTVDTDKYMSYYGHDYTELSKLLYECNDSIKEYINESIEFDGYYVQLSESQYLDYLDSIDSIKEIDCNNTYNFNSNLEYIIDYRIYNLQYKDSYLLEYRVHDGISDARVGYSDSILLEFNSHYDCIDSLNVYTSYSFQLNKDCICNDCNCDLQLDITVTANSLSEELTVDINDSTLYAYGFHTVSDIIDFIECEYCMECNNCNTVIDSN